MYYERSEAEVWLNSSIIFFCNSKQSTFNYHYILNCFRSEYSRLRPFHFRCMYSMSSDIENKVAYWDPLKSSGCPQEFARVKRDGSGWFINPPLLGWQIRPDERTLEREEFGLVRYWKALDLREATTSMGSSNYANPSQTASLVVVLLVPRGLKADTPTSWVNAI